MAIKLNGTTYDTLAEAIAAANEEPGTYVITVDSTSPNIISNASDDRSASYHVPVVACGTNITIDGVGNGAGSATLIASVLPTVNILPLSTSRAVAFSTSET